jgi:hypothetical protein
MKHAISELEIKLSTLETNEPIHLKEGNTEQAKLCATAAAEIRGAIAILRAVYNGPIWPAPVTPPSTRVEANQWLDFEAFVQFGCKQGVALHGENQMPWSFDFFGIPVTHESDDRYLVGMGVRFNRGQRIRYSKEIGLSGGVEIEGSPDEASLTPVPR